MDANIRRDGEELFHRKATTEHAVPRASENDKLRGGVAMGAYQDANEGGEVGGRLSRSRK